MSFEKQKVDLPKASSSEENYFAKGRFGIATHAIRELSKTSALSSLYHIFSQWLLLVAAITLCQRFWHPLLYVVVVAFIGARQHALLVLMHEGTHYRLFRSKRLNDWLAELFLAWPLLIELRSYRRNHLAHHQHLNTNRDPDWMRKSRDPKWRFPKRPRELASMLLADLFGLGALGLVQLFRSLSQRDADLPRTLAIAKLMFYAGAAAGIACAGMTEAFLLYWVVPYSTWLIVIMHVRSIAEHFAINQREGVFKQVRTTRAGWLARLFVAPENVNYHLEHHLFPSVPCYRLPELHGLLWSDAGFRASAHVTRSYIGVLRECIQETSSGNQSGGIIVDARFSAEEPPAFRGHSRGGNSATAPEMAVER
jgi:fatty acid desaturase